MTRPFAEVALGPAVGFAVVEASGNRAPCHPGLRCAGGGDPALATTPRSRHREAGFAGRGDLASQGALS